MNPVAIVRGTFGAVLLAAPDVALEVIPDARADRRARAVVRILGARHLAQAAVLGPSGARLRRLGVVIDALHCATALAVATADAERRRGALANAGTAALLAAAGAVESGN